MVRKTRGDRFELGYEPNNDHNHKMVEWRRNKVLELSSQGSTETDIADILQVSEPTISSDLSF